MRGALGLPAVVVQRSSWEPGHRTKGSLVGALESLNERSGLFSKVENHLWDDQTSVGCIPEKCWTMHDPGGIIRYIQSHHVVLIGDSPPQFQFL